MRCHQAYVWPGVARLGALGVRVRGDIIPLPIPLAAGALLPYAGVALNPSVAGAAMAFSSIAVVLNSVLLRGKDLAAEVGAPKVEEALPRSAA